MVAPQVRSPKVAGSNPALLPIESKAQRKGCVFLLFQFIHRGYSSLVNRDRQEWPTCSFIYSNLNNDVTVIPCCHTFPFYIGPAPSVKGPT